jgi:hypothetical protein
MTTTKYALAVLLGLIALASPRAALADAIVQVTISGLTFSGSNSCPLPSGKLLCSETLDASFQWDNTTHTYVAGSFSSSTFGALGALTTLNPTPTFAAYPSGGLKPGTAVVYFNLYNSNISLVDVQLGATLTGVLAPGAYSLDSTGSNAPFTTLTGTSCIVAGTNCSSTGLDGVNAASGSVSVAPVPEPDTATLLCAGLLCLTGIALGAKRLA